MSVIAMILAIIAASGTLAWGYSLAGMQEPARWFLVIGAIWVLAEWRRLGWIASLALLVFVGAGAFGLWIGLHPALMVIGAVGGLIGWDLSGFLRRMRMASAADDLHGMELRHLARVSIVTAISIIIAALSVLVHVRIPFELAVILALVGTLGITRIVAWLQRESDT